jgi:hypothetical protein
MVSLTNLDERVLSLGRDPDGDHGAAHAVGHGAARAQRLVEERATVTVEWLSEAIRMRHVISSAPR